MFSVIEHAPVPPLRWRDRVWKPEEWEIVRINSPRCLRLTVFFPLGAEEELRRRRVMSGLDELARRGVTAAVLADSFPYADMLPKAGIALANPAPLYRRMAGRLCEWAADEMCIPPSCLHVALVGNRAGSELTACCEYLRDRAGRISVSAGRDTEAVCFGLRKRLGIAAGQQASPDADIILLFDKQMKPVDAGEYTLVLDLTGAVPAVNGGTWANGAFFLPPKRFENLNFPVDTASLLAAMAASGSVRVGELTPEYLTACGRFVDLRLFRQGANRAANGC